MSLRAGPATSGRPLGGLQPAPRGCPAAPRGGPRPVSGLGTSKAGQGSMQSPRWRPLASRGGPAPPEAVLLAERFGHSPAGRVADVPASHSEGLVSNEMLSIPGAARVVCLSPWRCPGVSGTWELGVLSAGPAHFPPGWACGVSIWRQAGLCGLRPCSLPSSQLPSWREERAANAWASSARRLGHIRLQKGAGTAGVTHGATLRAQADQPRLPPQKGLQALRPSAGDLAQGLVRTGLPQ